MARITFEIEVAEGEVCQAVDMLKDIVQAFEFPEYIVQWADKHGQHAVGTTAFADTVPCLELPPVELSKEEVEFLTEHCNALIDDQEQRDLEKRARCGDLVEINGTEYVVTAENIDGDLELQLRDNLQEDEDDEEDCFLCPPPPRKVTH